MSKQHQALKQSGSEQQFDVCFLLLEGDLDIPVYYVTDCSFEGDNRRLQTL